MGADAASVADSMASEARVLNRHLRNVRDSKLEQFNPSSITNLKWAARLVVLILFAVTISQFLLSQEKYDQFKENFYNIQASEERMASVADIGSLTLMAYLMSTGVVDQT